MSAACVLLQEAYGMALFRPTVMRERLTDLTPADVSALGVDTLLLDVDNTLALHHAPTPLPGIAPWLAAMQAQGIRLFIVSNARGSRVAPFAESVGLPYFSLCQKPLPFGVNRAVRRLGVPKRRVLLCGDQLFTDMLAGRLAGVKTLLVNPARPEEKWHFRLRRRLEQPLLRRYRRKEKHS